MHGSHRSALTVLSCPRSFCHFFVIFECSRQTPIYNFDLSEVFAFLQQNVFGLTAQKRYIIRRFLKDCITDKRQRAYLQVSMYYFLPVKVVRAREKLLQENSSISLA